MRITIGEAALDVRPGELVRIMVAEPDPDSMVPTFRAVRDERASAFIAFTDRAGEEVAQLFYGAGWMKRDRRCRDGFHRDTPLIPAGQAPVAICWGDVKVLRHARAAAGDMSDADHSVMAWLVEAFEAALTSCHHPILTVS